MYTVISWQIVTGRQRGLVIWLLPVYFRRIDGATSWLFIAAGEILHPPSPPSPLN